MEYTIQIQKPRQSNLLLCQANIMYGGTRLFFHRNCFIINLTNLTNAVVIINLKRENSFIALVSFGLIRLAFITYDCRSGDGSNEIVYNV